MKKLIVLLCFFCSFPIAGSAQSPLADAARREGARQKAAHSLEDELHRAGGPAGWAR